MHQGTRQGTRQEMHQETNQEMQQETHQDMHQKMHQEVDQKIYIKNGGNKIIVCLRVNQLTRKKSFKNKPNKKCNSQRKEYIYKVTRLAKDQILL